MPSPGIDMEERDDAEMFKESGNYAFNAGHWEAAITYYTKALEARPGWGIVYSNRSHAFGKAGRFQQALEDAERCVAADGRWWKGFYRLGEAYMRLGRYEDAHAAFQRSFSCRSCPSDRCPELIKKLSEARRKAESSAGARDGGVGYASLAAGAEGYAELAEAGEAMKHGRWADVLVALDACAARDGGADAQSAHAKAMRAAAHMRLDDAPRALRAADAALQLNPLLRGARAVRARALAALQRHHEALACLDALEAIEAEPLACGAAPAGGGADGALPGGGEDEFCAAARAKAEAGVAELAGLDAEAAKARGNAAFNAGAFQEAIECYSAALGLRPNWAVAFSNRSCARLKLQQLEEALHDAERGVAADREWWKAHMRLGEAWQALGDHRRALLALADAREKVALVEDEKKHLQKIRELVEKSELASEARRASAGAGRGAGEGRGAAVEDADSDSYDSEGDAQELSDGARERAEAALAQRHFDVAIDQLTYALSLAGDSAELYALRCEAYMAKAEEARDPTPLLKRAEADAKMLLELDVCADAYFVAGELCERMGKPEQARTMYARAVEEDPTLSVALVKLCCIAKVLPDGLKGLSSKVRGIIESAGREYMKAGAGGGGARGATLVELADEEEAGRGDGAKKKKKKKTKKKKADAAPLGEEAEEAVPWPLEAEAQHAGAAGARGDAADAAEEQQEGLCGGQVSSSPPY